MGLPLLLRPARRDARRSGVAWSRSLSQGQRLVNLDYVSRVLLKMHESVPENGREIVIDSLG